jgi:hypothetical protein
MNKLLIKWFRQIHRWIAIPTALLIPIAVVIKLVGSPDAIAFWEKWDKLPSIFMLFMAMTGSYLYLLPYIVKAQRKQKSIPAQNANR